MDGVAEGGVVVDGRLFLWCRCGWEWNDIVLLNVRALQCGVGRVLGALNILGRALLASSRVL